MQVEEKCCKYDLNNKNEILHEDMFPEMLLQSVENIIKKEGYVKHQVYKRSISTDGGNYLGELFEVDVHGKTTSGDKETNIFIKKIIPDDNQKIFSVTEAYFKECFAYKELSKIFTELQNEAQVPSKERFKMAKSYEATSTEAIFLENLTKKGFTTLHRMDVMPLKFGQLAVQQLAKFHGLFYVIQKKKTQYFNTNIKVLKQFFTYNKEWKDFILNLCNISTNALSGEAKEKVEKFIPKVFEKYPLYADDTISPGCTICHGDYRVNNILVKKDIDGNLTEVVPVDYQLLYYGCPVNDLIYLLFNGSDQEFRKNHLEDLKNMYYDHLDHFLGYFDLDVNEIYPRKEFERQYIERLDLGLIYALYCTPFLFTREDNIPDIGKDDMTKLGFVLDDRYRERIQGIVDDFIRWGYL
ncbi:ecdysteroid kinase domain-containing protein [Phthorimaea operculella]|nr:ecdysteroid kinase domain-containing protein [Phthorimaea operculella]